MEVDLIEAHIWFSRAAIGASALNQERTTKAIEHLERYMTEKNLIEAKERLQSKLSSLNSKDTGA